MSNHFSCCDRMCGGTDCKNCSPYNFDSEGRYIPDLLELQEECDHPNIDKKGTCDDCGKDCTAEQSEREDSMQELSEAIQSGDARAVAKVLYPEHTKNL